MRHACCVFVLLFVPALHVFSASPVDHAATHRGRSGDAGHDVGTAAAKGVLTRLLGSRAKAFELELTAGTDTNDTYQVSAANGCVMVRGTSTVALVRGAYQYLRDACHCMVSWSGARVVLPAHLPDSKQVKVTSPYHFRQYYNVCTFGYTTVWWDWKRWERELDWMALHGINMPLALIGQVGVWQRVWESLGVPRDELGSFFTGPAFLPWHWMGNLNRHGGPLPQHWIDEQEKLQKKILGRMRELGMSPIVPAFSGFVPVAFKQRHPAEQIIENSHWANFPDGYQTLVLSPRSEWFQKIGARFAMEYNRTFGLCRYYLADTFNELDVPVSADHRYEDLAAFGDAVYRSIRDGSVRGVWVMQGWLFSNAASFWDGPSTRALLSRVPDNRMIILDLANEIFHGWKVHDGFYGKRWIYSIIHNFGGNNPLHGNLPFIATDPPQAVHGIGKGTLAGYGLAPEGIENNEVVYELLTDMGWKDESMDLGPWLTRYCHARYGGSPAEVEKAWRLLLESVYSQTNGNYTHAFQRRPSITPEGDAKEDRRIEEALVLMLDASRTLGGSRLFRNDLIDIASYVIGSTIDRKLVEACRAHLSSDFALRNTLAREVDLLLHRLDALVYSRNDQRLEHWISSAREGGSNSVEKALMEQNARMQLTVWGGPDLHDYASKVWSGLLRDFYAGRWSLFFSMLHADVPAIEWDSRLRGWEEQWTQSSFLSRPDSVVDIARAIRALIAQEKRMTGVASQPVLRSRTSTIEEGDSAVIAMIGDEGSQIRYTLDGSIPDSTSALYDAPLVIRSNHEVRARAFVRGRWRSPVASLKLSCVGPANGVTFSYYPERTTDLNDSTLTRLRKGRSGKAYDFIVQVDSARAEDYAVVYDGYLKIDREGEYLFSTSSDDGSRLLIDGSTVINNDGAHGAKEERGKQFLEAGMHKIQVRFFQAGGAAILKVFYEGPGVPRQQIPPEKLFLVAK